MKAELQNAEAQIALIETAAKDLPAALEALRSNVASATAFLGSNTGSIVKLDPEIFNESCIAVARVGRAISEAAKAARLTVVHAHSLATGGGGALVVKS